MSQEFYPYLMITADIILVTTLPLLLRLLTILLSRNKQFIGLESDFYRCLTHILTVDFVSALISILIVEPATYGIFRDFYENNSGWLSKIVIFHSSILSTLSVYFHSIIAFNRLTAILFTLNYQKIWTPRRMRYLHFTGWFLSIFLSLPLIWPIRGSCAIVKSPFGVRGLSFVLISSEANISYQAPPVVIAAFIEILILISYCIMVANVSKYKEIAKAVIRTTAASVFMCTSGWFLIIFVAAASYYGHAYNGDVHLYLFLS
ncbi:hypothetical protein PRIPAC_88428 [Pristionchus pacificus]|nr:hypothetical protein PRIPAC_88428 [Pristionchus pacificus]